MQNLTTGTAYYNISTNRDIIMMIFILHYIFYKEIISSQLIRIEQSRTGHLEFYNLSNCSYIKSF
jgi:hypothetical protein